MDSITLLAAKTDKEMKPYISKKTIIRVPLPTELYVFNVQFDDGLDDMASFFCKATDRVKILI